MENATNIYTAVILKKNKKTKTSTLNYSRVGYAWWKCFLTRLFSAMLTLTFFGGVDREGALFSNSSCFKRAAASDKHRQRPRETQ